MNDDHEATPQSDILEPDIRAHRARHPEYYARASAREAAALEALFATKLALEMRLHNPPDVQRIERRRIHEQKARLIEELFCHQRHAICSLPLFLSLTALQREIIEADCFRVDWENDSVWREV